MRHSLALILALALALPALSGCQSDANAEPKVDKRVKEQAAVKAAEAWLKNLDAAMYDSTWENASKLIQAAVAKDKWAPTMKAARDPLGKVVQRKKTSATYRTTLPGAPDGEYVVITYATQFENKKKGVETITPKFEDGKWKVSGYYIK